ncbi:hypothetical protein CRENBAI_013060 [Crenichthys baileyi]|uniref:Uncharacterized protein n=1 Tax=Crenichthys baileyi TaxID=28760 RepID=A0AAV9SIK1_9TELE
MARPCISTTSFPTNTLLPWQLVALPVPLLSKSKKMDNTSPTFMYLSLSEFSTATLSVQLVAQLLHSNQPGSRADENGERIGKLKGEKGHIVGALEEVPAPLISKPCRSEAAMDESQAGIIKHESHQAFTADSTAGSASCPATGLKPHPT